MLWSGLIAVEAGGSLRAAISPRSRAWMPAERVWAESFLNFKYLWIEFFQGF